MLLAGDVGGTKTNLAVFASADDLRTPLLEATFPSGHFPSLEALIQEFMSQVRLPVKQASIGVAGPVADGQSKTTNLPWHVDARQLREKLQLESVLLLNDLAAIANAVPLLKPEDLHTINTGKPREGGALAVIAPGTGLGEAFLSWNGTRYVAHESEGGHTDFAPTTPLQVDLLRYMQARFDHVSCERVCSGIGLPNIFAFLKDSGYARVPDDLAQQIANTPDPTPIIVNSALESRNPNEICAETLNLFVSILSAEAGNLALKVLATGGVYLGGGIPPRILRVLEPARFMSTFSHKGRFAEMLKVVPIHVIMNPKAALLGAAAYGFDMAS
ncbi:MAG: glk [Chloroflexi bacterium]|nr:glk [Chloroflexota bacterium]